MKKNMGSGNIPWPVVKKEEIFFLENFKSLASANSAAPAPLESMT
jgi:hypothetical protein